MSLKLIEVLVLVIAGAMFIGWQWHDLRRAREQTRKKRETERLNAESKAQMEAPQKLQEPREPHER